MNVSFGNSYLIKAPERKAYSMAHALKAEEVDDKTKKVLYLGETERAEKNEILNKLVNNYGEISTLVVDLQLNEAYKQNAIEVDLSTMPM